MKSDRDPESIKARAGCPLTWTMTTTGSLEEMARVEGLPEIGMAAMEKVRHRGIENGIGSVMGKSSSSVI